ncbi:MAG: DNA gyrase subunit A [candidate division KSB1 bacterium]|nr:DNA gyrase subunit A [candidate division KSB1 bacterium]
MKDSYLAYSMSVIVARALPDVRDGLKPVHRRVLYGMLELGLRPNAPYKKSARIVGEVLGKYHPHGDAAVYDAMVRMVQDFSMRYPLIDGQGNFGSVDGDNPAAMRYTEARLAPIAEELLRDLDKDTVDFVPNFDETLKEPSVLPALLPNLIVNGSSGIAVGMATNIPPHNLGEVVDALVALIDHPDLTVEGLMKYIKGPDFPTGGIVYGIEGVDEAYRTGRGHITVRGRVSVERGRGGHQNLIITELPYQVNKANLIERIAELVQERKLEGISDLRDESDREGMRIVVELKRDAQPEVVLNQLYKHTPLQTTFGVIMLALVDGQPRVLNLKQILQHFLDFRHEVVVRRTRFELDKAEKRAHILEGYRIALDHIDEVIDIIRRSRTPDTAKKNLMKRFGLSEVQAEAILDMRLQRLTGLERRKIEEEYLETIQLIAKLKALLESKALRMQLIKEELLQLKAKYGDERRTEIVEETREWTVEDFVAEEDVVIAVSHKGFIKRFPVSSYRRQGSKVKVSDLEDDWIENLFVASTRHHILFFTDRGRCYGLKVHEIPEAAPSARGRALANLLELEEGERVAGSLAVREFAEGLFVLMVTAKGTVKKTELAQFARPRRSGVQAAAVEEGDRLMDVRLTDGNQDVVLVTAEGKAIRFSEREVRPMGRTATGVRGISLSKGDKVVGVATVRHGGRILVVSEKGWGKAVDLDSYRRTGRGGKGLITARTTARTGKLVGALSITPEDEIMVVTTGGKLVRIHARDVRVMNRDTQGARLVQVEPGETVADLARVVNGG